MRDMSNTKSNRDNTKYSNYWLRNDLFDTDYKSYGSVAESKHSNLMALASYKRAISNFVNIVTGDNIKVKFDEKGNNSYTDGKTVVISAKMDNKEFDPIVGLALHEGSHIKLTDFSVLDKINAHQYPNPLTDEYIDSVIKKYGYDRYYTLQHIQTQVKDLLNVIEDRRIDYYIYSTSPGYKGYYHSMYDKYFNASIIDKGLKSSEYRTEDWESYMFRIINITNENRDLDALPKLREIFNLIDLKNISRLKNTTQAFQLACEIFKIIEDSVNINHQSNQNQPQNEGDTDGEDGGSGEGGNSSEATKLGNPSKSSGGESKQDSNDGDSSEGDAEGDEVEISQSNTYNPNGAGGGGGGIADKRCEGDGMLTDKQKKQLQTAIKNQKKFQDGDVKKTKVSKVDNDKIDTISKSGIDEKLVAKDFSNGWRKASPIPVTVVKNLNKGLVDSNVVEMLSNYSHYCARNQEAVTKGIQLGVLLGKRLKVRSEERSLITPRMKSGKIAGRLLHELGAGNFDIFDHTEISKHKPVLVHISIDASSSMGGSKWINSQIATVAIAKAASMTSNINVVISYRSTQHNSGNTSPLMLIAYDSRVDKFSKIQQLFQYLNPNGTTPEGLCFESIIDELSKTVRGTDTYFINFSDGQPGFSNREIEYGGDAAVRHTASQIKKITSSGIKVLSYFIEERSYGNTLNTFKEMYGKSAESINVTSIIPLAKTLNKLFQ